jgi:hypothetical protein
MSHERGIIDPRAPNMTPKSKQADVVPAQKKNQTLIHFRIPFAVMQKGARIGQEWPQGLIPCKRPSTVDACNATRNVMVVVAESIGNSF